MGSTAPIPATSGSGESPCMYEVSEGSEAEVTGPLNDVGPVRLDVGTSWRKLHISPFLSQFAHIGCFPSHCKYVSIEVMLANSLCQSYLSSWAGGEEVSRIANSRNHSCTHGAAQCRLYTPANDCSCYMYSRDMSHKDMNRAQAQCVITQKGSKRDRHMTLLKNVLP